MRRSAAAFLLIAVVLSTACSATDVVFDLNSPFFNAYPAANRDVTIHALDPVVGNLVPYRSGSDGKFTVTNMQVAKFDCYIKAKGTAFAIHFNIEITATNLGTIYADTNTIVLNVSTYPSAGASAWSRRASDARYLRRDESAPGTGESNTASNVGTGSPVFKDKSALDLRFRSFEDHGPLVWISNANTLQVNLAGRIADTNMPTAYTNLPAQVSWLLAMTNGSAVGLMASNFTAYNATITNATFYSSSGDHSVRVGTNASFGEGDNGHGWVIGTVLNGAEDGLEFSPNGRGDYLFALKMIMSTGGFSGPGSALTALNASALGSGTVPDARLSTNVVVGFGVPTNRQTVAWNATASRWDYTNFPSGGGTTYTNTTDLPGIVTAGGIGSNITTLATTTQLTATTNDLATISTGLGLTNIDQGTNVVLMIDTNGAAQGQVLAFTGVGLAWSNMTGGVQTPWTTDINANDKQLTNVAVVSSANFNLSSHSGTYNVMARVSTGRDIEASGIAETNVATKTEVATQLTTTSNSLLVLINGSSATNGIAVFVNGAVNITNSLFTTSNVPVISYISTDANTNIAAIAITQRSNGWCRVESATTNDTGSVVWSIGGGGGSSGGASMSPFFATYAAAMGSSARRLHLNGSGDLANDTFGIVLPKQITLTNITLFATGAIGAGTNLTVQVYTNTPTGTCAADSGKTLVLQGDGSAYTTNTATTTWIIPANTKFLIRISATANVAVIAQVIVSGNMITE